MNKNTWGIKTARNSDIKRRTAIFTPLDTEIKREIVVQTTGIFDVLIVVNDTSERWRTRVRVVSVRDAEMKMLIERIEEGYDRVTAINGIYAQFEDKNGKFLEAEMLGKELRFIDEPAPKKLPWEAIGVGILFDILSFPLKSRKEKVCIEDRIETLERELRDLHERVRTRSSGSTSSMAKEYSI